MALGTSVWLASPSAGAQDLSAEKEAYLALLERLAGGDADGAAKAVLAVDFRQTRKVVELVIEDVEAEMAAARRFTRNPDDFRHHRRRRLRLLKLSLLLHTEAALRLLAPDAQLLIARDMVKRLGSLKEDLGRDGPIGSADSERRPRSAAEEWADIRGFVRDWYLVIVSHLFTVRGHGSLRFHIEEGLRAFDDDPELLLASGALRENGVVVSLVDRSLSREIYSADYLASWRERIGSALTDFEKALQRQPDLHEARLRWGRVKALTGSRRDAGEAYVRVATAAELPFLRYLARLFAAELAEDADDASGARREYDAALREWPGAQAPKLALSRLCLAEGDREGAERWLARSISEVDVTRGDPWWDYVDGQAWLVGPRLAAFRARGLEP